MKIKYLSISGEEIESESNISIAELVDQYFENGIMISVTPLIKIGELDFWYPITQYGNFTKIQWIKYVCPQLEKVWGNT